jgi:UDP-N-acetyl-D-galactosamine dehydrogenase
MIGYHPQVILAGRRINDGMGKFIAETTVKQMIASGLIIKGAKANVLGLTFKENCADLRNSKVIDIIRELESYGIAVYVNDPYADADEALENFGLSLLQYEDMPIAEAIIVAVAHRDYYEIVLNSIASKLKSGGVFVDVKAIFDRKSLKKMGVNHWRL